MFNLQMNPSGYSFIWSYHRKLAKQLYELLLNFNSHNQEIEFKKQLGFQIDPWEHFFWFDAGYWKNLLLHTVDYRVTEELPGLEAGDSADPLRRQSSGDRHDRILPTRAERPSNRPILFRRVAEADQDSRKTSTTRTYTHS